MLLSFAAYQELLGVDLLDRLAEPAGVEDVELVVEPSREVPRAAGHELERGVLLAERSDPRKGALLRIWLDTSVAPAFADRVLPIDEAVARRAARLHVPDPAPFREALIAATALEHR